MVLKCHIYIQGVRVQLHFDSHIFARLIPKALGIDQNSRAFHFSLYGFMVSVLGMLITLTSSSTICVPAEACKLND